METVQMPPRGHYLAHEVGQLVGVSGQRIGQWARRGYIRSSQSAGRPRVYAYQDVVEAVVVRMLLDAFESHRAVRRAIKHIEDTYGATWPLTSHRIEIPTNHPIHEAGQKKRTIVVDGVDSSTGHPVIDEVDLIEVRSVLDRGGWHAAELNLRTIEVDPDRMSGRPVIVGTRMSAEDAGRLAMTATGVETLRSDYDLTAKQIDEARRWWLAVRETERAPAA